MMRVLRLSTYPAIGVEPTHAIVRDRDLSDTIESVIAQGGGEYGIFVAHEVFEMYDASLERAIFEATNRYQDRKQREQDQAALFHTYKDAIDQTGGTPRTVVATATPAPLTRDEVADVFSQLGDLPNYAGATLTITITTGETVVYAGGEIQPE